MKGEMTKIPRRATFRANGAAVAAGNIVLLIIGTHCVIVVLTKEVESHRGARGQHSCKARLGEKVLNFAFQYGAFWCTLYF